MVYNWLQASTNFFLPRRCQLCARPTHQELELCARCTANLPLNDSSCVRCANPLPPQAPLHSLCGRCSKTLPPFDRIIAPWLYAPPISALILNLKRSGKLPAGRLLGQLLAQQIKHDKLPQLLLPLPLHSRQLRQRGFNHSAEITRSLARKLELHWETGLLRKNRETAAQHGLGRRQRRHNLRNCFQFDNRRHWRHIALIDDIVTTGSTAAEASRSLRKAGVETVEVWAVARTPMEN